MWHGRTRDGANAPLQRHDHARRQSRTSAITDRRPARHRPDGGSEGARSCAGRRPARPQNRCELAQPNDFRGEGDWPDGPRPPCSDRGGRGNGRGIPAPYAVVLRRPPLRPAAFHPPTTTRCEPMSQMSWRPRPSRTGARPAAISSLANRSARAGERARKCHPKPDSPEAGAEERGADPAAPRRCRASAGAKVQPSPQDC